MAPSTDDANDGGRSSLPIVDPHAGTPTESTRVAGIVLAAGTGARYEPGNKLLADVGGEPIVRRSVRTLVDSAVEPVTVVVGHEGDRVASALSGLPVAVVRNEDYERGQSTSVRTGVEALPDDVDAAVIALGDMPAISRESVQALVRVYRTGTASALAAACDGERGNPVLFDRRHFDELRGVAGDRGGREILRTHDGAALVETGDLGVVTDVDRPADRERVRELLETN